MRFLRAFGIGLITAIAGMFLAGFALPAAPRKENEAWSDWMFATQHADLTPVPDSERIAVRYRVRVID